MLYEAPQQEDIRIFVLVIHGGSARRDTGKLLPVEVAQPVVSHTRQEAPKTSGYPSGEAGGDSPATAGGNGSDGTATGGSIFIGNRFMCGKKGHIFAI